jgi:predicted membrane protein
MTIFVCHIPDSSQSDMRYGIVDDDGMLETLPEIMATICFQSLFFERDRIAIKTRQTPSVVVLFAVAEECTKIVVD